MDLQEPVVVYTVKNATRAEIMKNFLESEGIRCSIGGERQVGLAGVMDIQIIVRAADAERARALLEEHERAQLAADEDYTEEDFGEEEELSEEELSEE